MSAKGQNLTGKMISVVVVNSSAEQIQRYRHRVSGPLLDRIDIQVEVLRPSVSVLDFHLCGGEKTSSIRARVVRARNRQTQRQGQPNALMDPARIRRYCRLGKEQRNLLEAAAEQFGFSPRSCHRVLKVSRTIADLDEKAGLLTDHLAEAIALRHAGTFPDAARTSSRW